MKIKYAGALLVSVAMSFILYGNSIHGDFVYDDYFFAGRPELREASHLLKVWKEPFLSNGISQGLFRPLASFSFNLNFVLFGDSTASFHLVNIVLHGIVTFLVLLLAQQLFKSFEIALFIALFYAFLPIHSDAVANIKGRDEILAALFGILAWLTFLWATEVGSRVNYFKIWLSGTIFLLAVLSKELTIVLPALFLFVYIIRSKSSLKEVGKISTFFSLIVLLYLFWRYLILGEYAFGRDVLFFAINPLESAPFWIRIFTALKIAFMYVSKTYIPWNLSATYHYNSLTLVSNILESWQAMVGLVLLITLSILATSKKLRNSPIGLGALTFLITYSVVSKIIFKGGDLMAERWMYFPSIGLSFIGGYLMYSLFQKRKKLGITIFVCVLLVYAYILIPRNLVWISEESLRRDMIKTAPQSIQGHYGLAQFYFENNRLEEAKKEAEIAYSIYKEHPPLLNTIGSIAYAEGDYALAESSYVKAIEVAPFVTQGYQNAAKLYYTLGKYEKAEELLSYLITNWSNPRQEDFVDYALVLAKLGKYDESLSVINNKIDSKFQNPKVRLIMAINFYKIGKLDTAKKYFDWNPELDETEKFRILEEF